MQFFFGATAWEQKKQVALDDPFPLGADHLLWHPGYIQIFGHNPGVRGELQQLSGRHA